MAVKQPKRLVKESNIKIELLKIEDLIPYHNNPRVNDPAVDYVASSIAEFGFKVPIVIDKDNVIVAGHTRLKAAIKLKLKELPCIRATDLTDAQIKAFRIADNKTNEFAEWDFAKLDIELEELEDFDYDFGFDESDFPAKFNEGLTDDDYIPEVEDPICKTGDLWQLGEHMLLCGDATKKEDVERLMGGKRANITLTSPPYNAGDNIRGHFYKNDTDNKTDVDYLNFLVLSAGLSLQNSDYVFWNIQLLESNKFVLIDFQSKMCKYVKDILIWNKLQYPPHINKGTFGCKWEYVFVFSENSKSRSFPCNWQGKFPNVIETENAHRNEYAETHKATFPVSFPVWIIEKMDFAKLVYDPFIGTGSTLIACEETGRICYGIEIDPHYCDVIIQRWEDFTGKKAELWQDQRKK